MPWGGRQGALLRGHEFHHSSLHNLDPALRFAYRVTARPRHRRHATACGAQPAGVLHPHAHLGAPVATDSEGYLLHLDDWSEAFARALAAEEGLPLTPRTGR
jgi:cobyrinic acid a,c-diamide synthase